MSELILTGKGYYIWQLAQCEGGDPERIAAKANAAGLSHVLIKIADGTGQYNRDVDIGKVCAALRSAVPGIKLLAWQYVYGYNPEAEAASAATELKRWGCFDAFVINAEVEYKQPGYVGRAIDYCDALRIAVGDLPVGLSTYRFPVWHPEFAWQGFLPFCDFVMPQVYWELAHNAADQLETCLDQYQDITDLPLFPTGAAYARGKWAATPVDVLAFLSKARELSLPAVNFWDWQHAANELPETWQAIADYPWPVASEPLPPVVVEPEPTEPGPDPEPIEVTVTTIAEVKKYLAEFPQAQVVLHVNFYAADPFDGIPDDEPNEPEEPPVDLPPVVPPVIAPGVVKAVVKAEKTVARFAPKSNNKGKPIMEIYEGPNGRVRYNQGAIVSVLLEKVQADGGTLWHELATVEGSKGEALYLAAEDLAVK